MGAHRARWSSRPILYAPAIPYSSNAVTIDAHASGGLITAYGDANFVFGTNQGDVIIGASNPAGGDPFVLSTPGSTAGFIVGDIFGGSLGNDTLTSNSLTLPDYVFTEGGADTITLAAGHTGADHVAFYAGFGVNETATALAVGSVGAFFQSSAAPFPIGEISSDVGGAEFVNSGWWGIGAGVASVNINTLFTDGTGTSADNSTLTGFNGGDILDFSGFAWSAGALTGGTLESSD